MGQALNDTKTAILERELEKYPTALDPNQVAEVLGVSRKTVDKLLENGTLDCFTVDPTAERKQKRVTKATIIDFMMDTKN